MISTNNSFLYPFANTTINLLSVDSLCTVFKQQYMKPAFVKCIIFH